MSANRRAQTVDDVTIEMWNDGKRSFADPGECVFGAFEPASPDRIGWWWQLARMLPGIDGS